VITPAACAITSISMDHSDLLGDTLEAIAAEKAGIMKRGVPVVTGEQKPEILRVLDAAAARAGTVLRARGRDWWIERSEAGLRYRDEAGEIGLPRPSLTGPHQLDNAGIAVAALRASGSVPERAYAGLARAEWPARMQRLGGRLAALLPPGFELLLDGGHNPGAGAALAETLRDWADRPLHLLVGMKQSKDAAEFLRPLLPLAATVWAVHEPHQHLALPVDAIVAASGGVARPGPTVTEALARLPPGPPALVLICGSLYLAGEVLKADWDGSHADGDFT
jgi:dihydrofolate synthase/folylpolyglutamate synthase